MADDWQVVAAIDFGTHGTGWAWATVDAVNNDASRRIINYKADHRGAPALYPKNLSALFFESGRVAARGFEARRRWTRVRAAGEGVQDIAGRSNTDAGYAYAFKMMLKPEVYHGDVPRGEGSVRLDSPDDARQLIVEYLRGIYDEVIADVGKRDYRPNHIRWCLTVPAIWDDADRALMRKAAVRAGLPDDENRLLLAIEPEAAALYCALRNTHVLGTADERELLSLGGRASRFMVVDCGGGTIDITAYKVGRAPDGSARLSEIGQPGGGKFGSEYTNAALIDDFLTSRLGAAVVTKAKRECPGDLQALQDQWESEKANLAVEVVDGVPHIVDPVLLSIKPTLWSLLDEPTRRSLTEEYGSAWGLMVPEHAVQKIFDAMLDPMLKVIHRQLRTMVRNDGPIAGPELLILVGGFGRSEYLQARITAEFDTEARVLLAEDPAGAVMFGAVHFCYNPSMIRARRAKFTVGYQTSMPFRHGTDPLESQFEDDDGQLYCGTRFRRLVEKGQSVEVDFARRLSVSPLTRVQKAVTVKVYATPDEDNPDWVTNMNGKMLGEVEVDLSESVGQPIDKRDINLFLYFGNTETRVRAVNPRTDQEVEAKFEIDYVR
jgi:hypothetical protein